jgi:hypothetical protein
MRQGENHKANLGRIRHGDNPIKNKEIGRKPCRENKEGKQPLVFK